MREFRVVNLVCTIELGATLRLRDICLRAANTEYRPRRFSALIIKKREPRCTILLFSTGRAVLTGLKCTSSAKLAARKLSRMLNKLGYNTKVDRFRVENVVGTFSCGYLINMSILQSLLGLCNTIYEPELFPGMTFKMRTQNCTSLIFSSGKIVLTGAKSIEHIHKCYQDLDLFLSAVRRGCSRN